MKWAGKQKTIKKIIQEPPRKTIIMCSWEKSPKIVVNRRLNIAKSSSCPGIHEVSCCVIETLSSKSCLPRNLQNRALGLLLLRGLRTRVQYSPARWLARARGQVIKAGDELTE